MNNSQAKAILFLMNEAKRNALGEDFAVFTGTTQATYVMRTLMYLNIDGVKYDIAKERYTAAPDSDASKFLTACGFFRWGDNAPAKVLPAKDFI